MSQVSCYTPHVARYASHITPHTLRRHITRHLHHPFRLPQQLPLHATPPLPHICTHMHPLYLHSSPAPTTHNIPRLTLCIPNRFSGSKTLHLHPPSYSHPIPPWSHTPNAPPHHTRVSLMTSGLRIVGVLQQVCADVCACVNVFVHVCLDVYICARACASHYHPRGTWVLFRRAGGMRFLLRGLGS